MAESPRAVERRRADSAGRFPGDILEAGRPVVLEDFVANWPLVRQGLASDREADRYLRSFYRDATVNAVQLPPEAQGRVFYNEDLSGFNFTAHRVRLDQVLDEIARQAGATEPAGVYVGSTTVDTCLPGLRAENDVELPDPDASPLVSIWLGNRTRVAAHFDVPDNLACNAVGRRRFTLFPPGEIGNLYPGPLDFTPAGQVISLVDFHEPDFERFPRFRNALEQAQVAELGPGDALFVPALWWHHVEALDPFNVLVNYWWRSVPAYRDTPLDALDHALLAVRGLPRHQREAIRDLFDHYVFGDESLATDHLPEASRGVLGDLDEATARRLRAKLMRRLNR